MSEPCQRVEPHVLFTWAGSGRFLEDTEAESCQAPLEAGGFPAWLHYGYAAAQRFGPCWRQWCEPSVIERDAGAWRLLAQVYDEIRRREDLYAISCWLHAQDAATEPGGPALSCEQSDQRAPSRKLVRNLLRLLASLGRAGVKPFDQSVLCLPPPYDVAQLHRQTPPRLRYLLRIARRLPLVPNDARIRQIVLSATPRRFNALARLADVIRRRGDREAIRSWLEVR